jgi:hypothetical protein
LPSGTFALGYIVTPAIVGWDAVAREGQQPARAGVAVAPHAEAGPSRLAGAGAGAGAGAAAVAAKLRPRWCSRRRWSGRGCSRRLAPDHERLPETGAAMVHAAMSRIALGRIAP